MRTNTFLLLVGASLAVTASSASACPNCKRGYVFGAPVAVGNGMAFTWAKLGAGPNKVESMGVTFTETAFEGLPENLDPKMPMREYTLEMPPQVKDAPFSHVTIDWNPKGHDPFPLYGKPHFDIHFFTISQEIQRGITATGKDLKKCQAKPHPKFIPAGYFLPQGTIVPTMGAHWIDPKSPELNGKPFSSTFLYGSYAGKTAFFEPMITRELLTSKPNFHQALPQPKAFDKTGFYPTAYSIKYNADRREVSVSLDNLTWAKAAK